MGVSDRALVKLRGFPAGVNNVAPDRDLPRDENGSIVALREAVNVDLVGPSRTPRRRHGYTSLHAGMFHSPCSYAGRLLAVQDGDLRAFDKALQPVATVRAGVGAQYLTYASVNDELYWSSPAELRRLRDDFTDLPGWIDCPGTPAAEPWATGGLEPGEYKLAMTWFDAEGRESGALGVVLVDVEAGGGIRVFNIPAAPEGAVKARLYVSPPNGEELYAALELATGVAQTLVQASDFVSGGKALETLWCQPMPPCEILRFWNGRLIGATGNLLVWSMALRHGLTTHDNYMKVGKAITMVEPIGEGEGSAGMFVADQSRTYWLAGGNPKDWSRVIRYDAGAVPGTSLVVKGTDVGLQTTERVVYWLAQDGVFCVGLPGGQVQPLTDGRLALPGGERGATMIREFDGLQQLVTSYLQGSPNRMAIGDRASAVVTRYTH